MCIVLAIETPVTRPINKNTNLNCNRPICTKGSDKVIAIIMCSTTRTMPANHKVSVAWQIVFTFLPILNLWAFYRIRKLRKYGLYVVVPSLILSIALISYYFNAVPNITPWADSNPLYNSSPTYDFVVLDPLVYLITQVIGWGLQGFAIYLVIIWSRKHNKQYGQPPTQTQPSTYG